MSITHCSSLLDQLIIEMQEKIQNLIQKNCSLDMLFEHPDFENEIMMSNDLLFEYISTSDMINQMFMYMYQPEKFLIDEKKLSKYAFFSFKVLSECHLLIMNALLNSNQSQKMLFYFLDNDQQNITSAGYFQQLMIRLISKQNPKTDEFINFLRINANQCVFPLVQNLTITNAEIIKEILTSSNKKLKTLQKCLFDYLLFFYLNEKFNEERVRDQFENLINLFTQLKYYECIYNFKMKYFDNLFNEQVLNQIHIVYLYQFKLILLDYFSYKKQITFCKNPSQFLNSYKKYSTNKRISFMLFYLLNFFKQISSNEDFKKNINEQFFKELIIILENFPFKDVIHHQIFTIFQNLIPLINSQENYLQIFVQFLSNQMISLPQKFQGNRISPHFIHLLLQQLDLKDCEQLQKIKENYFSLYTKLCFNKEKFKEIPIGLFDRKIDTWNQKVQLKNQNKNQQLQLFQNQETLFRFFKDEKQLSFKENQIFQKKSQRGEISQSFYFLIKYQKLNRDFRAQGTHSKTSKRGSFYFRRNCIFYKSKIKMNIDPSHQHQNNHENVHKPIPMSLQKGCKEEHIAEFLYNHVKQNNYVIQLYDVNEENLKNLKNISKCFAGNQTESDQGVKNQQLYDKEKKERMEYMIGNIVLNTRIKKLREENANLRKKIEDYQRGGSPNRSYSSSGYLKKKRKRKLKSEVVRNFKCGYPGCTKSYGSDNSLNQHVKLKHSDFWKKSKYTHINNNQDNIYFEEKEEARNEDIFEFRDDEERNNDNQAIDFDQIIDNF